MRYFEQLEDDAVRGAPSNGNVALHIEERHLHPECHPHGPPLMRHMDPYSLPYYTQIEILHTLSPQNRA